MILDHYKAVKALMPADITTYFGDVPNAPSYPYAVVWGDLGSHGSESLADIPDQLDLRPRVTYVAVGFDQVLWVAQKVRDALNRKVPSVTGWTASRLKQSPLTPPTTDFDVTLTNSNSHPVYAVDEYPFTSTRS